MSTAGVNSHRGYRFQDYVGLHYAMALLSDAALLSVEIDSTGISGDPHPLHVDDIVLRYADGRRRLVQAKMTAKNMDSWTIAALRDAGELDKIAAQLNAHPSDIIELLCPHGFGNLDALVDDRTKFIDLSAYAANASDTAKDRLDQFCKATGWTEAQAFQHLRQIEFGARHRQQDWKALILQQLALHVERPDLALDVLLRLMVDHSCKIPGAPGTLTSRVLREKLADAGIVFLAGSNATPDLPPREWQEEQNVLSRSTWSPLHIQPLDQGNKDQQKLPREGAQLYLALRPRDPKHGISFKAMEKHYGEGQGLLPLILPDGGQRKARTTNALCVYSQWQRPARAPNRWQSLCAKFGKALPGSTTHTESFSYLCDGELWMLHAFTLREDEDAPSSLLRPDIETVFLQALDQARSVFRVLGIKGPLEGRAGITGCIYDRKLPLLDRDGKQTDALSNASNDYNIEAALLAAAPEVPSLTVLQPFLNKLWASLHSTRPEHYDDLATRQASSSPAH